MLELLLGKKRIIGRYRPLVDKHKTRLHAEWIKLKVKNKAKEDKDLIPEALRDAGTSNHAIQFIETQTTVVVIPRYVRINLVKTTVDAVVKHFTDAGYSMVSETKAVDLR